MVAGAEAFGDLEPTASVGEEAAATPGGRHDAHSQLEPQTKVQ
jgi:hypothetical protein